MSVDVKCELEIGFGNSRLALRGDGTVYLPDCDCLLVSDLHLGKDVSFQRLGLPVPSDVSMNILSQLEASLEAAGATKLIILGDLIHDGRSLADNVVDGFSQLRSKFQDVEFLLVRGNHDRFCKKFPAEWKLETFQEFSLGDLKLLHDPLSDKQVEFAIGGHIHPVTWIGPRSQRLRLQCFASNGNRLALPAFGPFKGGSVQTLKTWTSLYPICDGMIWRLKK